MNGSTQYADYALLRQIDLQRVATWMLLQTADQLLSLQRDILTALATIDPTAVLAVGHQVNRRERLLAKVRELIDKVYTEITNRVEDDFAELADLEQQDQRHHMLLLLGADFAKVSIDVPDMLILGATFADWFKRQSNNYYFRVSQAITEGVDEVEAATKIAERLKGTAEAAFNDGVAATATNEAETILRTAVDGLPNVVSETIAEENGNAIRYGWQQISVLDSRTTQVCRDYAWKKWDMHFEPIGHKLQYNGGPPRHPNCRSRVVLILLDDPGAERNFKEWVDAMTAAEQAKVFGEKKAKLWKAGKISDTDLIRQRDRQMTLEEFRAKVEGNQ